MNHDDQDDLWKLLGQARPPRVSPFFSRNVLRAVREQQPEPRPNWLTTLRSHWRGLFAATAVLTVFIVVSLQPDRQADRRHREATIVSSEKVDQWRNQAAREVAEHSPQLAEENALDEAAHEVVTSPDFPVIENLDTLLASDDNDVWLDSSL